MPVSPCSFRSAQCAALIALAAAAGISRMEAPTKVADRTCADRDSTAVLVSATPAGAWQRVLLAAAGSRIPWMREVATFTLRLAGADDNLQAAHAGNPAPAPAAAADLFHARTLPPLDVAATLASFPAPGERVPTCRIPHALAFAVGPPADGVAYPPFAAGTEVPGDFAATGTSEQQAAPHDEVSSPARLARLSDPTTSRVGNHHGSGSRWIRPPAASHLPSDTGNPGDIGQPAVLS